MTFDSPTTRSATKKLEAAAAKKKLEATAAADAAFRTQRHRENCGDFRSGDSRFVKAIVKDVAQQRVFAYTHEDGQAVSTTAVALVIELGSEHADSTVETLMHEASSFPQTSKVLLWKLVDRHSPRSARHNAPHFTWKTGVPPPAVAPFQFQKPHAQGRVRTAGHGGGSSQGGSSDGSASSRDSKRHPAPRFPAPASSTGSDGGARPRHPRSRARREDGQATAGAAPASASDNDSLPRKNNGKSSARQVPSLNDAGSYLAALLRQAGMSVVPSAQSPRAAVPLSLRAAVPAVPSPVLLLIPLLPGTCLLCPTIMLPR